MVRSIVAQELIHSKIIEIRGKKVILDRDLASLYGVDTRVLKRAVRRNMERFPDDFLFELTKAEFEDLRSQIGISKRGGTKYLPFSFTENGVAMLSSVLNSKRAILVNIQIMRAFTQLKQILTTNKDIMNKISKIEKRLASSEKRLDTRIDVAFEEIRNLLEPPIKTKLKRKMGFTKDIDK